MSDQQHPHDVIHLAQVSAELRQSLRRCRVLLDDCRAKLAANSNELELESPSDNQDSASVRFMLSSVAGEPNSADQL